MPHFFILIIWSVFTMNVCAKELSLHIILLKQFRKNLLSSNINNELHVLIPYSSTFIVKFFCLLFELTFCFASYLKSSVRTINSENSVQRTALASKATMRDVTSVVYACVPQDGLVRTVPKVRAIRYLPEY